MTTLSLVIVERLESFEIAWVQSMHFGSQSPSQRPNDLGFLLRGTQFSWGFIVPRIIFHWTISREKRSMEQAACLMDWTVTHFTNFAFFPASEITQNFVIPPTETHAYNKALQGLNKKNQSAACNGEKTNLKNEIDEYSNPPKYGMIFRIKRQKIFMGLFHKSPENRTIINKTQDC